MPVVLLRSLNKELPRYLHVYYCELLQIFTLELVLFNCLRSATERRKTKAVVTLPGSHPIFPSFIVLTLKQDPIYVFPELKLPCVFPNFHIHISVSDLYIPIIGPPIFLQQNSQTDRGSIQIAQRYMNVETGNEAAQFYFWGIFVSNFRYSFWMWDTEHFIEARTKLSEPNAVYVAKHKYCL
jgi:hypothetical protein